jgi:deazaflavin-dependent oxidoreductase (nitroreductase family)
MTTALTLVRYSNPLMRSILRLGIPAGPNVLLTVRGRTTGLPRTAPVAVAGLDGRRWVIGAYGDVQWVRNLRAAGEATIRIHGRTEHVRATELSASDARAFYGATLPRVVAALPWYGRLFIRVLFRVAAPAILADPPLAAAANPVFELARADAIG